MLVNPKVTSMCNAPSWLYYYELYFIINKEKIMTKKKQKGVKYQLWFSLACKDTAFLATTESLYELYLFKVDMHARNLKEQTVE